MFKAKSGRGLRVPAKASLFYTAAGALAKATGLLFTPIFTRVMPAGEYGRYTLYITALALLSVISSSTVSGSMMYKGYGELQCKRREFTAGAIGLGFFAVLPLCTVALIFRRYLGIEGWFIPFLILQLFLDIGISAMHSELKYRYAYGLSALLTVVTSLLSPAVSLLFMRVHRGAYSRIIGLLTVSCAVALPFILRCVRVGLYKKEVWRFAMKNSLPLIPGTLAASVIAQADKLTVSAYMGAEALAPYAVAHSIGVGLTFVTGSIGSALHPWMLRKLRAGEESRVCETVSGIYRTLCALTVILTALAPEALAILTPESYSVALPAVLPIALSTLPSFLLSVATVASVEEGKPYCSSVSLLIGAGVNVVANILTVPRLSYIGAGLSLLLSYAAAAVVGYILPGGRSLLKRIRIWSLLRTSLLAVFSSLTMTLFYQSLPIRLLLLLLPIGSLIYSAVDMREYVTEGT